MKELLLKTTNILKKILKNYNLTQNGRKIIFSRSYYKI